jgi:LysR family hydrogen peroxide-inducible transcriptional activator
VRVEILRDPFVLAAAPGDPLAHPGPATVDELDDAPLLLLEDGHCLRAQALEVCARIHPQESSFRATSLSTLARMVASGVGVTLLPELALPVENRRGDLVVRRFADPEPSRRIVLAWRRSAPLGAALEVVGEALRAGVERPAPG